MLCEKPLSRHPEEVSAAFDAADRTGRLLSEAFMYRHNPQTKRLQELVDERRDRRAPPRPLGVQLLALRPRQHPAAHRRRGRRADGRRLLQRQRLAPARRRAERVPTARPGSARRAPTGSSRGRSASPATCSRASIAAPPCRSTTSSRRSAAKARCSSTTRGIASPGDRAAPRRQRRAHRGRAPRTPTGSSWRT